jgi:hypothetical protein
MKLFFSIHYSHYEFREEKLRKILEFCGRNANSLMTILMLARNEFYRLISVIIYSFNLGLILIFIHYYFNLIN